MMEAHPETMTSTLMRRHLIDSLFVGLLLLMVDLQVVEVRAFIIGMPILTVGAFLLRLRVHDDEFRPRPLDILYIGGSLTLAIGLVSLARGAALGVSVAVVLACTLACHAVRLWRHMN